MCAAVPRPKYNYISGSANIDMLFHCHLEMYHKQTAYDIKLMTA